MYKGAITPKQYDIHNSYLRPATSHDEIKVALPSRTKLWLRQSYIKNLYLTNVSGVYVNILSLFDEKTYEYCAKVNNFFDKINF